MLDLRIGRRAEFHLFGNIKNCLWPFTNARWEVTYGVVGPRGIFLGTLAVIVIAATGGSRGIAFRMAVRDRQKNTDARDPLGSRSVSRFLLGVSPLLLSSDRVGHRHRHRRHRRHRRRRNLHGLRAGALR